MGFSNLGYTYPLELCPRGTREMRSQGNVLFLFYFREKSKFGIFIYFTLAEL